MLAIPFLPSFVRAMVLLASAALCSGCLGSRDPADEWTDDCAPTPDTHTKSAPAHAILVDAIRRDNGAGISAAVMVNGTVVWADAAGIAIGDQALTPAARMRIGSVSKAFTAVLAARLAEGGRVDLDTPISEYVPNLPANYAPITIRQLATHTSGIRQYDFSSLSDSNNTVHHRSLADAFAPHLAEPLAAAPGQRLIYSSLAYNLLGVVVEHVTDLSYGDALSHWVTAPMNLTATSTDDSKRFTPCRPHFYSVFFGKLRLSTLWRDNSDLYPSGGLLATASDLARFANLTFASTLLDPRTKRLLERRVEQGSGEVGQGFGWQVAATGSGSIDWIGHGGTINGAYASLRYYPRYNMVVAGLANYDLFLTRRRAAFFRAMRQQIPALFSGADSSEFTD